MERLWGLLLATPLQPFQVEAMNNYTQRATIEGSIFGALAIPRKKRVGRRGDKK